MNNFWKALIFTAVPLFLLGVISAAGIAMGASYLIAAWFVAAGLFVPGFIIGIVFLATGKRQTGAGILAGLGISLVTLGVTCFASLSTLAI